MGFSRRGQAALYASLDRFQKLWNKSGAQFAAHIPFYPDCSTTCATDTEVAARPIRILVNADTKAPFSYKDACIELNPHVGGNPATAAEARKAVSDFLQALFKLG